MKASCHQPARAAGVWSNAREVQLPPRCRGRTAIWMAMAMLIGRAALPGTLHAADSPRDVCRLLGDRSDRGFAGRPGNLYAEVGKHARLIYMADDLTTKSSLMQGSIVEWRPDYVQLQPGPLAAPEGRTLTGVSAKKFIWIGPHDTLVVEYALGNSSSKERTVRIPFDLLGVADVKSDHDGLFFRVSGGYPKSLLRQIVGVLAATQKVTFANGHGQIDIDLPAGKDMVCVAAIAFGPVAGKAEQAAVAACSRNARQESTRYWNEMLTERIPTFACSDPYLDKLYYFRWWSLLTKLNVGGYGHWSRPLAREGTVGFNALITYSGGPNTIDLRWMRSPEWAYGNLQSFFGNLHEGKLANHIYPDRLDGDGANRGPNLAGRLIDFPYHNFLIKALADVYALHPDKEILRQLWPAVQDAASLCGKELDADHDGLYETYPWSNITGQEFGTRFLYFHPFDKLLSYDRAWRPGNDDTLAELAEMIERGVMLRPGLKIARTAAEIRKQVQRDRHYRQETVDLNCYAYADMQAMAAIAGILGESSARDRWLASAKKSRGEVLAKLWDPKTGFFYDRDAVTKQWSLIKTPTSFYPFWAGIGEKEHLPLFKHLFNPAEFWTPYPLPTVSMDYPKLNELRHLGWTYWSWNNWPMTTSHVTDAAARAAKRFDPSLTKGAAELLMRYTMLHFIGGDLRRPCISEHYDPISGAPNAPNLDYAHSYFIDLVMRHVAGIEAEALSDEVRIHPLDLGLDRFEVRNVRVKGHDLDVAWKNETLAIAVDGKTVATNTGLTPLTVRLDK
jgi:hypothetical protein